MTSAAVALTAKPAYKTDEVSGNIIMDQKRLRGSCFCGLVTYEVPDAFEYSLICHCSQCRRAAGASSKPFAGIPMTELTIHNRNAIRPYGDENGFDARCERCGSLPFSSVRDGAYAHVTLGTLLDDPSIRPSAHILRI